MKTMKNLILWGTFAVALLSTATAQQPDTNKDNKQPSGKPPAETGAKAADTQPASPAVKEGVSQTPTAAPVTARLNGETGLRLNFRGVPLEMVLNYLSDAAGFLIYIKPGNDGKGQMDRRSNQPMIHAGTVRITYTAL